jgi:hypothetical protein
MKAALIPVGPFAVQGSSIVLDRLPAVLGRNEDADVHLDDHLVSRVHFEKQSREKGSCPDCRVPQSCRLIRRLARQPTSTAMKTSHPTAANPAADRQKYVLKMCET